MAVPPKDKVYIDGSCDSKTLDSVLLALFERVSHVTHFYTNTKPMRGPLSVLLGPRIFYFSITVRMDPGISCF